MTLTLRAVSLNDHPLTQPITVHFDAQGGSIGRADHNTMALPDPKRHISRHQAEITIEGRDFSITNVGSANPIVVGVRTLARGESTPLAPGDRLRIGGYLLEVDVGDGPSAEAATITRGRAAVDAATPPLARSAAPVPSHESPSPPASTLFGADPEVPLSPGNPFAALLGGLIPAPATAPSHPAHPARAEQPVDASADPAPTPWPRLPDDFDPFAPPPPAASSPAVSADGGMPAGAFGDLIPGTEPVSIDRLFGLRSADGRDALADFLAAGSLAAPPNAGADVAVPGRRPPPLSTDPLALFGFDGGARTDGVDRAVAHPTAGDHVPELKAAFAPPRLALDGARSGDPRTSASTTGLPSADASAAAAWDAFCEGAGIAVERPQGADAEALRQIGAALRAAVDGTLRLMAVRASSKHELHAPVTVIQPQRNNPLKFSPDVNAALEQLLQPPLRGFMPGPAAVADAMDDLVGHAIGTIAGTRAALEGVLDRFAPRQLESKLAGRSVLDSVLPMNRKARLWELYLQHFETIRSEAQEDFHSLFGRAFLAAYEQQLEHLKRGDAPNG